MAADDTKRLIKAFARELGFDPVGVASAEPFTEDQVVALARIGHGLMDGLPWYTPGRVRRGCDPGELLPGARSIIALGMVYNPPAGPAPSRGEGKVARYAWGADYHHIMKARMRAFVEGICDRTRRPVRARWYVDDGPMLDRAAARRAGIGWFGKSTNILAPGLGSWLFPGQVLTDLELEPDPPLKKSCGQCRRCIDACPTGAIVAPYVVDNRRCISYLTIENRGAIPLHLRPLMGDWVFGCDICQEVCPVNLKAPSSGEAAFQTRRAESLELVAMLEMSEEGFRERFRNSPLRRAKRVGLQRNACVALGNVGGAEAVPALARVLREGEPLVRSHAAWALGRIGSAPAAAVLAEAQANETNPEVLAEIRQAIAARPREQADEAGAAGGVDPPASLATMVP